MHGIILGLYRLKHFERKKSEIGRIPRVAGAPDVLHTYFYSFVCGSDIKFEAI